MVCLALLPPLVASLATAREKESGTLLQVFVSGVSAPEYLLGKITAFCLVTWCSWLLLLSAVMIGFGLRFAGSPYPFLAGSAAFLFAMITFGVMIGVIVPNQAAAIQAIQLGSFVLSFLLSGFIFPLANIPAVLRPVSAITPATYFIEVSRDAFLRGGGWPSQWQNVLTVQLIGTVYFLIAWARMRRMQLEA